MSDPADDLALSLLTFYQEHRWCDELDSDVSEVTPGHWRVWIACRGCWARIERAA